MDWHFFVDFGNPTNAITLLTQEDERHLNSIASLSSQLKKGAHGDIEAWEALAIGLRAGRVQGIPDFRLEEASGLRGQFMLDLMSGNLDIADLISNAVI